MAPFSFPPSTYGLVNTVDVSKITSHDGRPFISKNNTRTDALVYVVGKSSTRVLREPAGRRAARIAQWTRLGGMSKEGGSQLHWMLLTSISQTCYSADYYREGIAECEEKLAGI